MSNKQQLRAGLTGFFIALVVAVTSCMKVDITMPEGPRGADGLSAYEVWKAGVADGSIPWDKSATAIVDFFKFLKGKDGKDGLNGMSAYDQWKELVAAGSVDDPHNQGEKWPTYATTIQDFWRFLTGATGEAGQTPHIGTDGNWWIGDYNTNQPARGPKGADGKDGKDGTSPVVTIGTNGNWYINGIDTGMSSRGANGKDGRDGRDGTDGTNGKDGRDGTNGSGDVSGHTIITIGENGNWFINGEDTGKPSRGIAGKDGRDGKDGIDGKDGRDGRDGKDATGGTGTEINNNNDNDNTNNNTVSPTITISNDNTWVINGVDTGKPVVNGKDGRDGRDGKDGKDGRDGRDGKATVVTIGSNGHWYIDGNDTGVSAKGEKGDTGAAGKDAEAPVVTIDPVTGNWLVNGTDTGRPSRGADGKSPSVTIGDNGNWFVDGTDTGKPAKGADGETPEIAIGENGNWFINGKDTGKPSYGAKGDKGDKGDTGAKGKDGINGKDGKDGKSTYELWKDYIADGTVPNPKDPSTTWPADKNTEADFFEYLCARTCVTCKEMEPKPTVELVNKTPGEEVDWKTGTTTFIVKDGDGNPIPGAKVSNLPGMPGKSYTADPDGKITVPNEDLPSIQEKEPRTGETTVTSNGSTKKSTPYTYVPNRVEVRFVNYPQANPFNRINQFPQIGSASHDDGEYTPKGLQNPVPTNRTNDVEYKIVIERRLNPKDNWIGWNDEQKNYLAGELEGVQLIPKRVTDKRDPSSSDTDPKRQISYYDKDYQKTDLTQNVMLPDGSVGKRVVMARTVRRHMLKNYLDLKNWQPNLYDEREDVYFTFVVDRDIEIYGVKPKLQTTFQLPPLQIAPPIKELKLQDLHDVTYPNSNNFVEQRFKKVTFTLDYSETSWEHFYKLDDTKVTITSTGSEIVSFTKVPAEEAKAVKLIMVTFNDQYPTSAPGKTHEDSLSAANLLDDNLGSGDHPTCHTDDTADVPSEPWYNKSKKQDHSSTVCKTARITIDMDTSGSVRSDYKHWFRGYNFGTIVQTGDKEFDIEYNWPKLGKKPTHLTKVTYEDTNSAK